MDFSEIITQLGGSKVNSSCGVDNSNKECIIDFENNNNVKFPNEFKQFYLEHGAISFLGDVKVYCSETIDIVSINGYVDANFFYSFDPKSKCFIGNLLNTYEDQIPKKMLPFCDGVQGDLICLSLADADFGSVYYWFHEGFEDHDLFKISESFEDFFKNLTTYEEEYDPDVLRNIKVTVTDDFLARLKKSGYGPKEG